MSLPYAAGSLYSTVDDLYRWDRALYGGAVVTPKSYALMTTAYKNEYGYGLQVEPLFKHKQGGHGGGINGFSTCMQRFPDDDAVVIVLSNVADANACAIGKGLSAILFGEPFDMPREYTAIPLDPKVLDRFAGKYAAGELEMTVTVEGRHLFLQIKGQPRITQTTNSSSRLSTPHWISNLPASMHPN